MKRDSMIKNLGFAGTVLRSGFLVLIFAGIGMSQNIRNTDHSPDSALKSNARVNPSTLAMELSIPLGGYPGRAGSGLPISLNYSSKVWEMKNINVPWQTLLGFTINDVRPEFANRTAAGWSSSLATPRIDYAFDDYQGNNQEVAYEGQIFDPAPWEYPTDNDLFYIKRLRVQMPDGSTHEFRASDTPIDCGSINSGCASTDFTGTFLSVDGSRMRLESGTSTSTLFLPDGSRYVFGAMNTPNLAHTFYDRHGNKMTFNTSTRIWTDTMGRSLPDPLVANWNSAQNQVVGEDQTKQYPGLGSSTYDLKFSWKNLGDALETSGTLQYKADKECSGNIHTDLSPALFSRGDTYTRICNGGSTFNPIVLTKIKLPNGQFYEFKYNVYGEITKITSPNGAYERFVYGQIAPIQVGNSAYDQANRGVTQRFVSVKGDGSDEISWTYTATRGVGTPYIVAVNAPDGSITQQYIEDEPDANVSRPYGFSEAKTGRSYEDRVYDTSASHFLLQRNLSAYEMTGPLSGGYGDATRDMRPTKQVSITFDPTNSSALATMSETIYDTAGNSDPAYFSSLNAKQTKKYHYIAVNASTASSATLGDALAWFSGATPAVVTETDYLYDANYKARNITGLVIETRVEDASNNAKAKSQITYDGLSLVGDPTSTRWENPSTIYRGLVTKTRTWHDIANNLYIDTQAQYDLMGNLRYAWDGKNNLSQTAYSSAYDYAFPTNVTTPVPDSSGVNGSNTAFTSSTVYDYNTGLPTSTIDINGQTSSIEYIDALLRPTKTTAPNGRQTTTQYGAGTSSATRWVKLRSQIDASSWSESLSYFDGWGRTWKSEDVDSNGNIFVEKEFDSNGRISRVTNPFRAGETKQWTTNIYDEASRIKEVILPDTSKVLTSYGVSTSAPLGVTKTVTDQAGKKRKGFSDALGRMVRVVEDPTGLNLNTDYVFDTLGNLRKTTQGEQSRFFMHDSLGRLLYAKQPEQTTNSAFSATDPATGNTLWTAKYEYDNNSNISKTTDARGVYVQAAYDNRNRITTRDYSDATPDVSFYYDGRGIGSIPTYSNGKTTKVTSSVSEIRNTSFNNLGRLLTHQQITDGQTYSTAYTYNLSGGLIEQAYPSGRVVKSTLDTDGDLSQVQSKKNVNTGFFTYADRFSYDSAGGIKKMQLGNGKWETASYNDRLQVKEIGLGTTDSNQNLLKLEFSYGTSTQNNGSVREQKVTVPAVGSNPAFTAIQTYTYDDLNRIKSSAETIGGPQTWKQTFEIDRYGNREFDAANTTTIGSCAPAVCNPNINTSDNRFSGGQGYSYDANGNVTQDATSQRFAYDAENYQKDFFSSSNPGSTPDWTYSYDGDGRRVKKASATEVTVFVYDAGGLLVAEYSSALASIQQVSYLTTDHLGTPRIITNENGVVTSRKDTMAFGSEALSAQRLGGPMGNGYNASNVRQEYTGYEKDSESGLEFAQARQYNSMHGRFTSVDPLNESGITANPQTFNRYTYVSNDPLNSVDPSGMSECSAEYSYSDCGGDAGFWGGEFGDSVAAESRYNGGAPAAVRTEAYNFYLQRVTNAQNGYGFVTSAEVGAGEVMFTIFYGSYDESTPQAANPIFSFGINAHVVTRYWHQEGLAGKIGENVRGIANGATNGLIDYIDRNWHGMEDEEFARLARSPAAQGGENAAMILGIMLPGPGGKVKAVARLDEFVRGSKQYGKDLFKLHAGDKPLTVMRDLRTNRIKGVRTVDGSVMYRPKNGKRGLISNVEIINASGMRVNIHIQP